MGKLAVQKLSTSTRSGLGPPPPSLARQNESNACGRRTGAPRHCNTRLNRAPKPKTPSTKSPGALYPRPHAHQSRVAAFSAVDECGRNGVRTRRRTEAPTSNVTRLRRGTRAARCHTAVDGREDLRALVACASSSSSSLGVRGRWFRESVLGEQRWDYRDGLL